MAASAQSCLCRVVKQLRRCFSLSAPVTVCLTQKSFGLVHLAANDLPAKSVSSVSVRRQQKLSLSLVFLAFDLSCSLSSFNPSLSRLSRTVPDHCLRLGRLFSFFDEAQPRPGPTQIAPTSAGVLPNAGRRLFSASGTVRTLLRVQISALSLDGVAMLVLAAATRRNQDAPFGPAPSGTPLVLERPNGSASSVSLPICR